MVKSNQQLHEPTFRRIITSKMSFISLLKLLTILLNKGVINLKKKKGMFTNATQNKYRAGLFQSQKSKTNNYKGLHLKGFICFQ